MNRLALDRFLKCVLERLVAHYADDQRCIRLRQLVGRPLDELRKVEEVSGLDLILLVARLLGTGEIRKPDGKHENQRAAPKGRGKLIDSIFGDKVEPKLIQPTFIFDYPTALSPLAKKKADDPETVERFELFVLGFEIANAYSELNDPVDQRQRMEEQASKRAAGDEEAELIDTDFLTALEHGMPPAGGLGIGVDRVVSLMTGEHSLREVILFPTLRPETAEDRSTEG